jgi:hypothetical protein
MALAHPIVVMADPINAATNQRVARIHIPLLTGEEDEASHSPDQQLRCKERLTAWALYLLLQICVERVMRPYQSDRIVVAATVAVVAALVTTNTVASADGVGIEPNFISRVVAQTTRSGLAIRGTRDLRAGTVSGKHHGWMRVETTLTPAGHFSWTVLEEGGSSRTREKVLQAVLQTEAASARDGDKDAAALTPANYTFSPLERTANGEVRIRLTPRREDSRLIEGILTVSSEGYPVRLEGTLAKSPSFWVKSVRVVKHYGRFAGVALPTVVESTADLKLFGKSTFTMRYDYQEVNGRSIPRRATHADSID